MPAGRISVGMKGFSHDYTEKQKARLIDRTVLSHLPESSDPRLVRSSRFLLLPALLQLLLLLLPPLPATLTIAAIISCLLAATDSLDLGRTRSVGQDSTAIENVIKFISN